MPKAIISYDQDLPSIEGRCSWEAPTSHLVKDGDGWREAAGRRVSPLLLVPKIRAAVDDWRAGGYAGASEVTRRLFEYWFEEEHVVAGFGVPFRFYFCQREAIETLVWLVEIAKLRDAKALIEAYGTTFRQDLTRDNIVFQTTMDGQRQIRLGDQGEQNLPPENLRRFAFKMATGSGKTWVMAMAIVWARFHKMRVPDSPLSTNFLIVAPNVIVYQRLEKDFASNRVFDQLPLIPPEWRGAFSQKVLLRGDASEPNATGNLFLTNIHQLYESRDAEWTPANAIEKLLGRKPAKDPAALTERSMLERVKSLGDVVVLNDEAHHVHNDKLAWNRSLLAIHHALPQGISAWLDFSATPRDQDGRNFAWTVADYPLAQAVEDRIVKAPLIVTRQDDPKQPMEDPEDVTQHNVAEKYGYWLRAAVERRREHEKIYKKLDIRPVLFIMAEKNVFADALGKYLCETKEFGFKASEVLVIHTDKEGEITKKDLETARKAARDIDAATSSIRVIVSVMMLREGWDVRNVTVVLGLRPFTAKAEILPEQVIGRGLRLTQGVGPDRIQTLEVLGTRNLLNVLRNQLEAEGVGVAETSVDPPSPVIIQPLKERLAHDIAIPITKPSLVHNMRKLSELDVSALGAIYEQDILAEAFRTRLKLEFATTETEVHQVDIAHIGAPVQELLANITNKVMNRTKLSNRFSELYPIVRYYVTTRCFGQSIDPSDEIPRSHLERLEIREGIAKYLAAEISDLTIERRPMDFEKSDHRLSETKPFPWRRNLPPMEAQKTIFNYVATYNDFERRFATFLDRARDVVRFAALGTTEQGDSGAQFRVDYLKSSGAIGFYHPDWVVVQKSESGEVNWIIETKGRVWQDTTRKDEAMAHWCARVSAVTGSDWRYLRVNQREFDTRGATHLEDLLGLWGKEGE